MRKTEYTIMKCGILGPGLQDLELQEEFRAVARRERWMRSPKTVMENGKSLGELVAGLAKRGMDYLPGDIITTIGAFTVDSRGYSELKPVDDSVVRDFHQALLEASRYTIPVNPHQRF